MARISPFEVEISATILSLESQYERQCDGSRRLVTYKLVGALLQVVLDTTENALRPSSLIRYVPTGQGSPRLSSARAASHFGEQRPDVMFVLDREVVCGSGAGGSRHPSPVPGEVGPEPPVGPSHQASRAASHSSLSLPVRSNPARNPLPPQATKPLGRASAETEHMTPKTEHITGKTEHIWREGEHIGRESEHIARKTGQIPRKSGQIPRQS